MRFYSPNSRVKEWYCTIVYRDGARPLPVRVGDTLLYIGGKGTGEIKHVQFQCKDEHHSVEIYPPGKVFAVICSPEEGLDPRFMESLAPRDEVELSDPRRVVTVEQAIAWEKGLLNGNTPIEKVINGR